MFAAPIVLATGLLMGFLIFGNNDGPQNGSAASPVPSASLETPSPPPTLSAAPAAPLPSGLSPEALPEEPAASANAPAAGAPRPAGGKRSTPKPTPGKKPFVSPIRNPGF